MAEREVEVQPEAPNSPRTVDEILRELADQLLGAGRWQAASFAADLEGERATVTVRVTQEHPI